MNRNKYRLTSLFICICLITGLFTGADTSAKVKKPTLSKKKVTLTAGGKKKTIKVKKSTGYKLSFSYTKEKNVSVKRKGVKFTITPKKAGKSTLTIKAKKKKKSYKLKCKITIKQAKTKSSQPALSSSPEKTDETVPVATVSTVTSPSAPADLSKSETPAITTSVSNTTDVPAKTEVPAKTVTPVKTDTPAKTDAPATTTSAPASTTSSVSTADKALTLSAATLLNTMALDGSINYNADGSVTFTAINQYSGGGVGFYIDSSKSSVDVSEYNQIVFNISSDVEGTICPLYFTGTSFGTDTRKEFDYTSSGTTPKDYKYSIPSQTKLYGLGVKFNTYNIASPPDKLTITIHSIKLISEDPRPIPTGDDDPLGYTSLYSLAKNHGYRMGTVVSIDKLKDKRLTDIIKKHFNSITASNEMKAYSMLDIPNSKKNYVNENSEPAIDYTNADIIADFAKENNIKLRGHALVWDSEMLSLRKGFFCEGYDDTKPYVSAEVMKKRLKSYINQVLTHFETKYPGVFYCWDAVNEAVGDDSSQYVASDPRHVRTKRGSEANPFYDIIGDEYVKLAFEYADDALKALGRRDDIKLIYNDYSTFEPAKRDAIIELIKSVNSGGRICDGIGMQSYIGGWNGNQVECLKDSDISLIKTAIEKFHELGVDVHVTEMAVRNYLGDSDTQKKHGEYYGRLFAMYDDLNKGSDKPITSISIWGLYDMPDLAITSYTYRQNGPYCGLFDENLWAKEAFKKVYDELS